MIFFSSFHFVSVMKINFNNLVVWQMINQIKSKHINIIDFFGVNNDDDFCQLRRYYLYHFFGLVIRSMFVVWWPFAYSKIIINNIETLRFDRSIDQSIDHFRWSFFSRSIHPSFFFHWLLIKLKSHCHSITFVKNLWIYLDFFFEKKENSIQKNVFHHRKKHHVKW